MKSWMGVSFILVVNLTQLQHIFHKYFQARPTGGRYSILGFLLSMLSMARSASLCGMFSACLMSPLSAMMKLSVSSVLTCSGLKKSALTVPDQEDCLRQLKSSSSECFQYLYYCFFIENYTAIS